MPTTRSSTVKQEPVDDAIANMHTPTFSNANFNTVHRIPSNPYSIQSLVIPCEPQSSGSTVRNDDIEMTNGHIRDESSEGTSVTSNFAQHPRKLIKVIQKLSSLNIDATLPSLPKIVVVGDQSHGKSSIVEAVCDISLPRSEGTCTRCPFQLITTSCLTTKEQWSCKISLLRKYSYSPRKSPGQMYPHWIDADHQEIVNFAYVTEKDQLEHVLRLAQSAILNPDTNPADVLRANNLEMTTMVNFSPNIIQLEVASGDLPELSLLDLPGAINVAEQAGDQYLVTLVEKLIKNSVKDDKALILLAVAASGDTENSTAFRLLQDNKALHRTLGVLTKPDLMTRSPQHIQRMLNGESFKVGNQWFVTKQLSQKELDAHVPHYEARAREHAFFATHEPWCSILAEYSDRFGIVNLQETLANKLTEHILSDMPEINARVTARLQQVNEKLAKFPEQVKDLRLTIMTEIDQVVSAISGHLRGDSIENEFRSAYRKIMQTLRKQLQGARPQLVLISPGYKAPAIQIDSDDEALGSPEPSPAKSRKGNDGRAIASQEQQSRTSRIKTEEDAPAPMPAKTVFTLEQLKRAYDRGATGGLPDQINPKVTDHLILQCVRGWHSLTFNSMEEIKSLMVEMLSNSIQTTLVTRRETQFFADATQIVEDLFLELLRKQQDLINTIIAAETHKPITYAYDALKVGREAARVKLKDDRSSQRVNEFFDKLDSKTGKLTKAEDRTRKTNEVLGKLGADPYHREITAMATPLAYYDIAAQRFLDDIAKHLELGLMHALQADLKRRLVKDLRAMDTDHCAQLLAEDPRREEQRRRYIAEKEKLTAAMNELQGLR